MLVRLENVRCKVLQADEGELRWLRTYLTFPDERARFGLSTGLHLFNSFAQSFPAGLLPIVLKGAPDADVQVTVEDGRTVKGPLQNPDLSWLRDYQGAAVVKCVEATRGIMKCPTGSGKTEIAIGLASKIGCRWLFLVHRASLLQQTAERYEGRVPGETAGRVGDHQWQVEGSRFVVGMFQTIHAALKSEDKEKRTRARALLGWAEGLIVDECFVAGTPVGGQPIETLREGDTIPSYDSRAGQFVRRRIVRRFARRPSALVRLTLADGRTLVCTPEHRFLTPNGWQPAYGLCGLHMLSCTHEVLDQADSLRAVRGGRVTNDDTEGTDGVLHRVPRGETRRATQGGDGGLCRVRTADNARGSTGARTSAPAADLLRSNVPIVGAVAQLDGDGNTRCGKARCADAEAEPDVPCRRARATERNATSDRSPTTLARGEGPRNDGATTSVTGGSVGSAGRLVGGVPDYDGARERPAELHLPRLGEPGTKAGGGSGRRDAPNAEGLRCGPAKGSVPALARVARVEVLEPGLDGRFGGACPDGLVYNVEVEDTHTYLVDGLVAHNCHVLPAASFWRVVNHAPHAYWRFGMSGTPLSRTDKRSVLAVAQLGPVIYAVPASKLVEDGILARPMIRMASIFQRHPSVSWAEVYRKLVVESEKRNRLVIEMARAAEKPCLVFVKEIDHGRELSRTLSRAGVSTEFVWGSSMTSSRRASIRRLERGDIEAIVCSVVFQEGIDIPTLRSVVVAAGGKSPIATLQRIGRGMRMATDKDSFEVWDVYDRGNKWLERHARARAGAYRKEGYEVKAASLASAGLARGQQALVPPPLAAQDNKEELDAEDVLG